VTRWRSSPDAAEPVHGWHAFGRLEVTRRPLVDAADPDGLYARLTYRDALACAERHEARLPTRDEVIATIAEARRVGVVLAPVTLSHGPEMVTRAHAAEHDRRVQIQLDAADVSRRAVLVAGIGKHWVAGAAAGRSRICGWPRADGTLIQQGTTDIHDDGHHDYASLLTLVRDVAPPPRRTSTRGAEALAVALAEAAAPWAGAARVALYHHEAMRRSPSTAPEGSPEHRVGITTGNHCASAVCYTRRVVEPDASLWPHAYRCSVWEMIRDGRERGTWRDVRSGYVPRPGDVVCQSRRLLSGVVSDPRVVGAEGHVGRAVKLDVSSTDHLGAVHNSVRVVEANGPGGRWHKPLRSSEIVGYLVDTPEPRVPEVSLDPSADTEPAPPPDPVLQALADAPTCELPPGVSALCDERAGDVGAALDRQARELDWRRDVE
jgi:hypothetical protein